MSKFNVGDIVIGNDKNAYYVTRKGWTGRVLRVGADVGIIAVTYEKTDACPRCKELRTFYVKEEWFDLYQPAIDESSLTELDDMLAEFSRR